MTALLLAEGGWVAEAGIWSLFWWEDGRLAAPPLALGVLPGVARARIEEQTGGVRGAPGPGGQLRGRPLFVANAVRGVVPVAALDGARGASDRGHNGARTRASGLDPTP